MDFLSQNKFKILVKFKHLSKLSVVNYSLSKANNGLFFLLNICEAIYILWPVLCMFEHKVLQFKLCV